jgi:hypothetical protein
MAETPEPPRKQTPEPPEQPEPEVTEDVVAEEDEDAAIADYMTEEEIRAAGLMIDLPFDTGDGTSPVSYADLGPDKKWTPPAGWPEDFVNREVEADQEEQTPPTPAPEDDESEEAPDDAG